MSLTTKRSALLMPVLVALGACSHPPIRTVPAVDLERFMGDWYVIAHIPTAIEDEAYNAVENYALNEDGTIATTFTFNKGGYDGKPKKYEPKGFPKPETGNAVWGMQFIWPIKAEYRIMYLDDGYSTTVVGRSARDYVWIMARKPVIEESQLTELRALLVAEGYELDGLRMVPQRW